MKNLIIILSCLFTLSLHAQTVKTETFTVKGNCEECKERIENAADIQGVKICKWNPDTKVATVTYDPNKVSLLHIKEAIARRGYDAGEIAGNNKPYNKLPGCCKYRDGVCDDKKK
jgi:periplasmic mercuric ion binding protein